MRLVGVSAALTIGLLVLISGGQGGEKKEKKSKLDGTWKPVSVMKNGKEEGDKEDHKLILKGDTFTIMKGDGVMAKGTMTRDKKKTPHEIDMTVTEADKDEAKGKVIKGIYELKDDTLKWCFSMEGERPTEFAAPEGKKVMFITLKRDKK
jgi:uncharacterized protein (TIGR03067 family)